MSIPLALRLEGDVELEVSYQPHFNTITKTGDANFSKIPHAVAELIDNSIQVRTRGLGDERARGALHPFACIAACGMYSPTTAVVPTDP